MDLRSDEGLREACKQAVADIDGTDIDKVAQFLEQVHNSPPEDRSAESFVRLVWEENPLDGLGHGDYSLEDAYKSPAFRDNFARLVNRTLPEEDEQRLDAINRLLDETGRLASGFVAPDKRGRKYVPVAKTLRALAALFPFDLTPPTYVVQLNLLHIAMDLPSRTHQHNYGKRAEKSREIIGTLDRVLGSISESDWTGLATRRLLARHIGNRCSEDPDSKEKKRPMQPTPLATILECFERYRADEGLVFDAAMIEALHLGLWANERRHFAVLTGLSGIGKTKLALRYRQALTGAEDEQRDRMCVVSVEPGWHDPSPLLGFVNPLNENAYNSTDFVDFLLRASKNPSEPYVAVLDEMNLSHPEQYLAPLISAMERRAGHLELHKLDADEAGIPQRISYPPNLVLIGTVNMDETTMGLSDKVLGRAFTLEFWDVDVNNWPGWDKAELGGDNEKVKGALNGLMEVLSPARLHFGWRVIEETVRFMERRRSEGANLSATEALDRVIYAKVLPKLRGDDSQRYRTALDKCEKVLSTHELHNSAKKVEELRQDLRQTGSFRFWR